MWCNTRRFVFQPIPLNAAQQWTHLCVFNLQSHTHVSLFFLCIPAMAREDYAHFCISVVCVLCWCATAAPVIMCPLYVFCKKKSHELRARRRHPAKRTIHCSLLASEPWNIIVYLCYVLLRSWESQSLQRFWAHQEQSLLCRPVRIFVTQCVCLSQNSKPYKMRLSQKLSNHH